MLLFLLMLSITLTHIYQQTPLMRHMLHSRRQNPPKLAHLIFQLPCWILLQFKIFFFFSFHFQNHRHLQHTYPKERSYQCSENRLRILSFTCLLHHYHTKRFMLCCLLFIVLIIFFVTRLQRQNFNASYILWKIIVKSTTLTFSVSHSLIHQPFLFSPINSISNLGRRGRSSHHQEPEY